MVTPAKGQGRPGPTDARSNPVPARDGMRGAALKLAAEGFRVFPLVPDGKVPIFPRSWSQLATVDPTRVAAMWTAPVGDDSEAWNIGTATGEGTLVLDVDIKDGAPGEQTLEAFELVHGDLPPTRTVHTPSGGRHLYFRVPAGIWIRNGKSLGPGIDVKGDGGYVVGPGSVNGAGAYTLDAAAIADAPQILIDRTCGPRPTRDETGTLSPRVRELDEPHNVEAAIAWLRDGAPPAGSYQVACELRDRGLSAEKVLDLLDEIWNERRHVPRDRDHLEIRVRNAYDRAQNAVGSKAIVPADREFDVLPMPLSRDGSASEARSLIQTAADFVAGFRPPNYLVDGMLQRGYLYSLTARTGHGKTAVGLFLAQAVARGIAIRDREVLQGSVLYLAGENPDDIRARFLVLADRAGFDPATIAVHFLAGVVDIKARMAAIRADAARIGDLALVIVDTAAAYYRGDDANSNVQQGEYARLLRKLTALRGRPAALVMAHPVKNAAKDNLLPSGGGAFLNEVDGNLTLWAEAERLTAMHWQGKFRGPEFEPLAFHLKTELSGSVKDARGKAIPSVVAYPVSDAEVDRGVDRQGSEEERLLLALHGQPGAGPTALARACGFILPDGEPYKSKASRILTRLRESKLVEIRLGKYQLTARGRKEVESRVPTGGTEEASVPPDSDPFQAVERVGTALEIRP